MRWRPTISIALTALVALALTACSATSGPGTNSTSASSSASTSASSSASSPSLPLTVVTTTNVYASIAQEIGGDLVEVTPIIDSTSQDPHSYEATARDRLAVQNADLVILNGGGYDDFMSTLVQVGAKSEDAVLDAVAVSGPEDVPSQGTFNEHVWYSLSSMRQLGNEIAEKLSALTPERAADYAANTAAFIEDIDGLQARLDVLRESFGAKTVAETEPASAYLIRDAGLQNQSSLEFIAAVQNQQEVSQAVMREMSSLLEVRVVRAFIMNTEVSTPQIEQLAEEARAVGTPILTFGETIDSGLTYQEWMSANIDKLASIAPAP